MTPSYRACLERALNLSVLYLARHLDGKLNSRYLGEHLTKKEGSQNMHTQDLKT